MESPDRLSPKDMLVGSRLKGHSYECFVTLKGIPLVSQKVAQKSLLNKRKGGQGNKPSF